MQEHNDDRTTQTTGRGYNRHTTDPDHGATDAVADLYSPVPGDDNDTRPGMVGSSPTRSTTPAATSHEYRESDSRSVHTTAARDRQWDQTTTYPSAKYTMGSRSSTSDSGIMKKIQDNPLAVVAAATAGGLLAGRIMRNRSHRNDRGYLRASSNYGYQGYQQPQSYRQPAFYPYQANPGYQGYQAPSGYRGIPQYRADQEFRPEQGFQGRHENFPGGSNWD